MVARSRLVVLVACASLVAGGLLVGSADSSQAVPGAFTFQGNNVGPIPDGGGACAPTPGSVLNVTFNVTGMPPGAPSDVRITGLALTHTHVGDVTALLIAPNGASHVLFGRTGATAAGVDGGFTSNLAGPYSFADDAPGNWWSAAAASGPSTAIPSGAYRTSAPGGAGSTGALTNFTADFSTVTNVNATWTLRFYDGCGIDTGEVTAATLELAPKCAPHETAVGTGQAKVAAANAAVSTATAAAAAAETKVQDASAVLKKGKKKLAKAKKALRNAEESGLQGAIEKAKKKLAKAKKALKKAKAKRATAQENAAAADQKLTGAQAAAIAAQAELIAAQSALASCKAPA